MADKSPFYVVEDFISPLMCEELIDIASFTVPDTDKDGKEVLTTKTSDVGEEMLYERFRQLIPTLEQYYGLAYKGTERMSFEWMPQGYRDTCRSENSNFLRGKWLRTKQRDLTGVIFLSDYQDQLPFEQEFEVYGGKLEFPQHAFGFNPKRGTLVVFPSDPHFINVTSPIDVGDLFQVRIQLAATAPYLYNPQQFPGNFTTWFK